MPNQDFNLLVAALNNLEHLKTLASSPVLSSKEEFACNDTYIKMGVGALVELVNITNKISATTVLVSPYLTKELPMLNRYKECIFNPDNSVNAYKLYDFLTLELKGLEEEVRRLIVKS